MVKKKPGRDLARSKKSQSLGQKPNEHSRAGPEQSGGREPARKLKKKLAKRVSFHDKVAKSHKLAVKSGSTKKHKRRKKTTGVALGDLSGIAEALGLAEKDIVGKQQQQMKGLVTRRAEARRKLTGRETVRLQKVLAHPQFKRDPISAVAEHLQATLPAPEIHNKKPHKNVSGSQKEKARRQRARVGGEMEF